MQRLFALALTVFALAAVPAALGDGGTTGSAFGTPPAASAQAAPQQGQGQGGRLELLRLRIQLAERRFAKNCGGTSAGGSARCLAFATKAADRLAKVDSSLQGRIAKIQQACTATSTDQRCTHAADRIALLQQLDTRVQALAQKAQDWLGGKTVSTDPSSDSSLDQAAAGLGKLAGGAASGPNG